MTASTNNRWTRKNLVSWLLLWTMFFSVSGTMVSCRRVYSAEPAIVTWVTDTTRTLSPVTVKAVTAKLSAQGHKFGDQVIVVILPTLDGKSPHEAAIDIGRKNGVGQRSKNNGVVFLIAKQERKIRIEVAYGLEHKLTDAKSKRIITTVIAPKLKTGNYDAGVSEGVDAILAVINQKESI